MTTGYDRKQAALDYHAKPRPGKLAISITKPFTTHEDLSLAYSPGVAQPVKAIENNPDDAFRYTSHGNLIGVVTNGAAGLGLGNTGALAREPVPATAIEAHSREEMVFGPDYIISSPFDPRLINYIPPAVAVAAVETGVARTGYPQDYPVPVQSTIN